MCSSHVWAHLSSTCRVQHSITRTVIPATHLATCPPPPAGPSSSLAAALPAPVNFLLRCVCCLMSCVMAAYLGLCHLVTATASVAVLDFMNLVSTARPGSDMYFLDDLAFMDAYKAARWGAGGARDEGAGCWLGAGSARGGITAAAS